MTRTMYDSTTMANIPDAAAMVAAYVDGRYANVPEARARFPHAVVAEIAVSASTDAGQILDVEQYDAAPTEAPGWVQRRRAAGVDPSVYCNSSTWPAVRAAFAAAAVAEPHWWIAQYDNDPTIPAGAVAKQYQDAGPYDISSVADYWPGIDPQEAPVPALDSTDLANIRNEFNAALRDPANRSLAVADDLWWWQHALAGTVPSGASPAAAASIQAIHAAYVVLATEPEPKPAAAAVEAAPAVAEAAPAPTETPAEPAAS